MASAAFAPRGAPPAPTAATLLLLLLLLAGGGLEAEGCLPCRLHFKNLKGRFARLCAQYRERFGRQNCTSYPWGRGSFQGFALDELSLDLILEKTHRVFRVIEINQTLEDFPKFWDWLHEVKMWEQSREALCPPACHVSAPVVNCSSCRTEDTPCWEMKTCYPERLDLPKAIMLLSTIACSCFFLGMVTCALEFRFHPGVAME
ncbi:sperm-egg fusion protein TMEM95 isoform X1 [Paroedura picta]|uniref:sperm-egg fusion protein TMEM95 isoform X1 n=1 Tax=Paroedura picta TaxID=143630 RepID=UPI00405755D1